MAKNKTDPKKEAIRLTKLWQQHGPNTYPIDVDELVNGVILSKDFPDQLLIDRQSFDSFEGSLVRTNGTCKWTMLLNTQVPNGRRRRFTFAHELGHFMCHRELRDKFEDSEESLNDFHDEIETEANIFASWLLMPANLLRDEFQGAVWETETLRAIGNRFECSLQASALRYVSLCTRPVAFVVSRDGMIIWATKSKSAPFMTGYCFGDELPNGSHALAAFQNGDDSTERKAVEPVWNDTRHAFESQYFDSSGQGYQYTCIEFQ
ncbi:ImmA/IrrE family metallo-endopeptidase [Ruegeria arenilitoris]|uniref:ImmA/IrrE family metallo-endopeptidase n=1 Tax=Ruegeria arenilitoris TaxID=1173585 RepID=UPI0014803FFD|nr:ImmA/IrrE family metallo-endopeptidase [Ruegeria arenilitoris]